jgi:hypothetical protein
MDVAKVYVRNTGQNALTSLSVYVNDEPAHINMSPATIASGAVGTITVYNFIAEGDTIKITSPSGFSTSKKAQDPCNKAVGCWKFNEGSGNYAYDSSPSGNTGTFYVRTTWTPGIKDGAMLFNGNYLIIPASASLDVQTFTIEVLTYSNNFTQYGFFFEKTTNGQVNTEYSLFLDPLVGIVFRTYNSAGIGNDLYSGSLLNSPINNRWNSISCVYNGTSKRIFVNGVEISSTSYSQTLMNNPAGTSIIGAYGSGEAYFYNGTIEEVRVYNRAIY